MLKLISIKNNIFITSFISKSIKASCYRCRRNNSFLNTNICLFSTSTELSNTKSETIISEDESTYHTPVMRDECITALLSSKTITDNKQRKIFIDGTLGGGGHTLHLLKQLNPNDVVFGCDVDADAINNTSKRLCKYMMNDTNYPTFIPIQCNFCNVHDFLQKHHSEYFQDTTTAIIDGILLDLGVSSYQIDTPIINF